MDALTTLLAAIPSLAKAGADIAAASDEAKRNAQLIEFQRVIIQLQSSIASIQVENSSLQRDKENLERQLAALKDWENEKRRYALVSMWEGAAAFALKESMSNGEVAHWVCANCFNVGKKTILSTIDGARGGFTMLTCSACKSQFQSPYRGQIPAQYAKG